MNPVSNSSFAPPPPPPAGQGGGTPGVPPGVLDTLSEEDASTVKETLANLSAEQRTELKDQLDSLHDTAREEGLSLEEVSTAYLDILSDVSSGNSEGSFDISTQSAAVERQGPPVGAPPGVLDALSEEDGLSAVETLASLTEDQKVELRDQLQALHETAREEGLSIDEIADQFVDILSSIAGDTEPSAEQIVDTYA